MKEKRKFKRLPKKSKLLYKFLKFSPEGSELREAQYKDVGGGGILFETEEEIPIGTLLKIEFDLQGWHKYYPGFFKFDQTSISEPITVVAQVVRVREIEKNKKYEIGVKFVNIDESYREGVINFIEANFGKKEG